jgi:hypothetical protein
MFGFRVKVAWALIIAAVLSACASEGSDQLEAELRKLDASAGEGVAKISKALNDPALTSPALGEGTRIVANAAHKLSQLEDDERASDFQQLMAILYQARAWDDVAIAYATTPIPASLAIEQRTLVESLLAEKAMPARMSAAASFERARERACKIGFEVSPVMAEIMTGLSRYTEVAFDAPCPVE